MIKNHFVHSLWTSPMANDKNKLEANVYIFALSLTYLKNLDAQSICIQIH